MDTKELDGVDLTWVVIDTNLPDDRGRAVKGELRVLPQAVQGVWVEEVDRGRVWHVSLLIAHIGPTLQREVYTAADATAEAARLRRMLAEATLKNDSRTGEVAP